MLGDGCLERFPVTKPRWWLVCLVSALPSGASAQRPVSLSQAIEAALTVSPRSAMSRADSAAGVAGANFAKAWPNPAATVGYSKAIPNYHVVLDIPIDYPWLRGARIDAAEAGAKAAGYRSELAKAAIRFQVEAAYVHGLASQARARIARSNAQDADSLVGMTQLRRDAGDASDLDVLLVGMSAGQLANTALSDSIAALAAVLEVQQLMGLPGDTVRVVLSDTLALPRAETPPPGLALPVAAAEAELTATQSTLDVERRRPIPAPTVQVGLEGGDPTGAEPGLLPTVGLTIPLPLFNQNGGAIALAEANRVRAEAELAQTRLETEVRLVGAYRDVQAARNRAERGQSLARTAAQVAVMARTAYAEGAVSLPYVLEAQRGAREAVDQLTTDLAAAVTAYAALRFFTASVAGP